MAGEAAYMLSKDFIITHPSTPWSGITAMRPVLVRGYHQIEKCEIWNVIKDDLPSLYTQVEGYVSEIDTQNNNNNEV